MKKLLLAAATATVFTLGFGAAPASAAPNFSQFCTDNGDFADFGYTHGTCTSVFNGFYNKGKGNNDVSAYCKALKTELPDDFAAFFKNHGDCIKQLGPFFPG